MLGEEEKEKYSFNSTVKTFPSLLMLRAKPLQRASTQKAEAPTCQRPKPASGKNARS